MWDWWDKTVDAVTSAAGDALDWVNDVVDTYVWDTTENEAVVESWVRDTFNIPDQEGKGFVSEAWDKVNEVVDTYIWDTTENEAVAEGWVRQMYDIPDQEAKGFVEEAVEKVTDDVDRHVDDVKQTINKIPETVTNIVTEVIEKTGDIINNISLALGVGFDAAMAAIGGLPDLLTKWRDELANWFEFDIEEFMGVMNKLIEKTRPADMPSLETGEGG